jgi:flagellar biosynthesis protein FlhB
MFKGLPTKQRLLMLKRRGVVSISGWGVRAISLGVVLVALVVTVPRAVSELERVCRQGFIWKHSLSFDSTLRILVATSLGVVVAAVLSVLLQSRGAFGWSLLSVTRKRGSGIARVTSYLAIVVFTSILSAAILAAAIPQFLGLLRAADVTQAVRGYAAALASNVKLVVVGAVVCAILSSVLTRFFFLVKNRARSSRGAD